MLVPDVNDQINEKSVVLCIRTARLDAKLLAKAMTALLKGGRRIARRVSTPADMSGKGRQTVKQLARQGRGVSSIEVKDSNIRAFDSVARKYGVDFALKKDKSVSPPVWLVFFKAQDADALTSAFKEFTAREAKRKSKPSVLATLRSFSELVKRQVIDKVKDLSRGGHGR